MCIGQSSPPVRKPDESQDESFPILYKLVHFLAARKVQQVQTPIYDLEAHYKSMSHPFHMSHLKAKVVYAARQAMGWETTCW